uniref:Sequestosome 1 n=1 Tax=Crocodylus porosus TaxID=8502 RepID=A0A7M4F014_CROPO
SGRTARVPSADPKPDAAMHWRRAAARGCAPGSSAADAAVAPAGSRHEDGDMIAFSSDEELELAWPYVKDGVFRVYIKEKKECRREHRPQCSQEQPPSVVHPNVICDGCEGPVVGARFKCTVCPDYDLCSTCEGKGLHKEHNMVMFQSPLEWFPRGRWLRKMRHGAPPFAWLHSWGYPAPSAPCQNSGQEQAKPSTNSQPQDPNVTFLKNVGESVAAFLSPLGIEVDIDVEHGGQRSKVTPTCPSSKKSGADSAGSPATQNSQTKQEGSSTEPAPENDAIAEQMQEMNLYPKCCPWASQMRGDGSVVSCRQRTATSGRRWMPSSIPSNHRTLNTVPMYCPPFLQHAGASLLMVGGSFLY